MKNKKAALYVRVSTSYQIDKDSLPFQKEELSNYSKYALGIDDFEIFEDAGYSAKNTARPAYQDMMRRIRDGEFTHMIVWKIDRISRNLRDFTEMYDELKDYGVTFVSKNEQFDTSSAMGEAMVQIILVFAQLERKLTAERVFSIMMNRAEKGLWNGAKSPFGYVWSEEDKYPVPCEKEGPVIKKIFDMYSKKQSALEVSRYLNNNGIDTKRGGRWTSKTIVDIIRSPFYKGTLRYNYRQGGRGKKKPEDEWIVINHNHKPLVSGDLWQVCNDIMDKNSANISAASRRKDHVHVFSGLLKCAKCRASFSAGMDRPRADGFRPSVYRCRTKSVDKLCDASNPGEVSFGPFVISYLSNFIKAKSKLSASDSPLDLQDMLLDGVPFKDVDSIDRQSIEITYKAILQIDYIDEIKLHPDAQSDDEEDFAMNRLKSERAKLERALSRWRDLFLFSEDSISEKDFLIKKLDMESKMDEIDKKLENMLPKEEDRGMGDISFLKKSAQLLFVKKLLDEGTSIEYGFDYKKLLSEVGKEPVKEFVNATVKEIAILDGVVSSITFANGLVHKFKYK
ncbi:DNA-invertase hin [Andreesenia angusta]|uniref:DNA-invertase hin n=1 Tax=Andreesenia angusta TaxID=39480 RepID=A0A1S1V961_9FIRM|nr:recombinase family protein [Andreesenia angusta]OHW62940.1 DNA-invertase hin [Andreesenia angusta]